MKTLTLTALTAAILMTTAASATVINGERQLLSCSVVEVGEYTTNEVGKAEIKYRLDYKTNSFKLTSIAASYKAHGTKDYENTTEAKFDYTSDNIPKWAYGKFVNMTYAGDTLTASNSRNGNTEMYFQRDDKVSYYTSLSITESDIDIYGTGLRYMTAYLYHTDKSITNYREGSTMLFCGERRTVEVARSQYDGLMAKFRATVTALKAKNMGLQSQLATKRDILAATSLSLAEANEMIDTLNAQISGQQEMIAELMQQVADIQKKLTAESKKTDLTVTELQDRVSELLEVIDWYIVQNGEYKNTIVNLENEIANAEVDRLQRVQEEANTITTYGQGTHAGSMGFGLSIIGLIGLVRRKMK